MSKQICIEMLVRCPVSDGYYPYDKCRHCMYYHETMDKAVELCDFDVVTMWCEYDRTYIQPEET